MHFEDALVRAGNSCIRACTLEHRDYIEMTLENTVKKLLKKKISRSMLSAHSFSN